ncbi:penicillin acylase family protein [Pseudoduganella sp. GCM10020061]|uniref:penicillin acylase family protein n=1 Tax=Pseudoduganella sp. GCM10020061 TaxID=3317345 RepID=UPI00363916D6
MSRVFTHRISVLAVLIGAGLVLVSCGDGARPPESHPVPPSAPQRISVDVARTTYGIAHINANDFRGLGYGLAYAYAQDNVCMFADSLLTVRGERSRFFGPGAYATRPVNGEYGAESDFMELRNDESDFFFKGYLDLEQLKSGFAAASQEARDMLEGYAAGYNRYLRDYAGRLPAACASAAWVRPITREDLYLVLAEKALHASGQVFAREFVMAGRGENLAPAAVRASGRTVDPDFLRRRLDKLSGSAGSNALALGKSITADTRGILYGSPHYPWTSTDRFYQAHLTIEGKYDAMGVILGGIPTVVIGFNKDIAWTHTVTTAVHFTNFMLKLDPSDTTGTTYFVDGKPERMTARSVTIDVLQPDGSMSQRTRTFYFSKYGPVIANPMAGIEWTSTTAFVLADPNRNNTRLMDQWLGIARARNVAELKSSLETVVGLPWVNTIAADRHGGTLYMDASVVPHVSGQKFASDCFVLPALLAFDGSRSSCGWGSDPDAPPGVFSPRNAPYLMRGDYVGNSNDSFWLTNPKQLLTGYSPMYGQAGIPQKLRTRIGFLQMEEQLARGKKFAMADVEALAYANRIYAAELILPELLLACPLQLDLDVLHGCAALAFWDKRADLHSRGAVLFREFWNSAALIEDKWAVPFDPADPVNTPRGLKPSAAPAMFDALKGAVVKMRELGIPLDRMLAELQGETRNGNRWPLHGAIGDIDGSYNSIHMATPLTPTGYHNVEWGTSYVQVVGFDANGPVPHGLLAYGQSTDPKSPHYGDQVPLYTTKSWPLMPFSQSDIKRDPNYVRLRLTE